MNLRQSSLFGICVRATMLICLAIVSLTPSFPAVARQTDTPVDLPAMALRPADFAAEGRDGYGQSFGYLADRPRKVAEFVESLELDVGNPDGDILSGAGAERAYVLQLGRILPEDSDIAYYSQSAISFILEFDDDDGAGDAISEMEDQWLDAGHLDTVRRAGRVGDDSFYLEGDAINATSSASDERSMLVFQVENIVAGVVIINSTDDDLPTQELTENLALRQADRIEAVLDGDESGSLSNMALRLRVDGDHATSDSYIVLDGEAICTDVEIAEPGSCDDRQDEADDRQIENYYFVDQRVAGDYFQGTPESYFWVYLRTFSSVEAAATDYQRLMTPLSDDEVIEDVDLGDEAFSGLRQGEAWTSYTVVVRVGDMVVTVGHRTESVWAAEQGWTFEPSESATFELAERQTACMEGTESCVEPVRIPQEMIPTELEHVSFIPGGATVAAITPRDAA